MYGWRARIGHITPGGVQSRRSSCEWNQLLPDGVEFITACVGVQKLAPEEFDRAFPLFLDAAKRLATWKVDFVVAGGLPVFTHKGLESAKELQKRIAEIVGVPAKLDWFCLIDALNALSAKNVVVAAPYEDVIMERERQALESFGFNVLAVKGLGLKSNLDFSKLPSYASYQVAKDVFREAPEADAINVTCGAWETVANIEVIEKDLGIPVVTSYSVEAWAALRALHIREPVKGCGKLMRELL